MGTHYMNIVLETSPDRRRSGTWERLGKNISFLHIVFERDVSGRLFGLMTSLAPLSRRIQILKDVLFTKVPIGLIFINKKFIHEILVKFTESWLYK